MELIRQESKFLIPKKLRGAIEEELNVHMHRDEIGAEYQVKSLYCHSTKSRFRIRIYNSDVEKKFLEFKGKTAIGRFKRRIEIASTDDIKNYVGENYSPTLFVTYARKAWGNGDSAFRVTIDENVRFRKATDLSWHHLNMQSWDNLVIMEMKYKDEPPEWMKMMIEDYGLQEQSFSKFKQSMNRMRK